MPYPLKSRNARETVPPDLRRALQTQYAAKYGARPSGLRYDWDDSPHVSHDAPTNKTLVSFFGAHTAQSNRWLVDGLCWLLLDCSLSEWLARNGSIEDLALGELCNVPALPPCYIERHNDIQVVKDLITQAAQSQETSPKVAIVGMGGLGKTSLATSIARNPSIQQLFPDGIFWLTLGPQPNLILRQLDLLSLLSEETLLFQDVDQGKLRLERFMAAQRILLILDDVWDLEHFKAFDIVSSQICILMTTRDRKITKACQARTHYLKPLSDSEAVALLNQYYPDRNIPASLSQTLIRRTGHHPLALAMLGTRLTGETPQRWETTVTKSLGRKGLFNWVKSPLPDYRYKNLAESVEISIRQLDPETLDSYKSLVIFPKSVLIPESVLLQYWQMQELSELDAEEVIYQLVDHCLLQRSEDDCLSLHGLHYEYLQNLQADPDHVRSLHHQLIQSYRKAYPDGLHTVESDGYFYRYVTYHLREARLIDDLYTFLSDLATPLSSYTASALEASKEQTEDSSGSLQVSRPIASLSSTSEVLPPESAAVFRNCFEVYMTFEDMPELLEATSENYSSQEISRILIRFLEAFAKHETQWRPQVMEVLQQFLSRLQIRVQTQTEAQPQLLTLLTRLLADLKAKQTEISVDVPDQTKKP